MANSDILITLAGQFPPTMLDRHAIKALLVLSKWMDVIAFPTNVLPTAAQQNTIIGASMTNLGAIPDDRLPSVELALWQQLSIGNNATNARTASAMLAAAQIFLALPDPVLERVRLYLLGRNLNVIS